MTPSFALSLSYERIRLLHRAAGGWQRVGDVPLTVEDLSASLRVLKKTATALHASALRTKLVIPTEQIRFLKIETGEQDLANRRIAAEQALDGVTPYDIPDLSIDVVADGPITYVAAVARETLAEAEAFAVQHGFDPVSFVASPDPSQFAGEPFFGPTIHAASVLAPGEFVSRDRAPVDAYSTPEPHAPAEPPAQVHLADDPAIDDTAFDDGTNDPEPSEHLALEEAEATFEPQGSDALSDLQEPNDVEAELSPELGSEFEAELEAELGSEPETPALEDVSNPENDDWALSKIIDAADPEENTPAEIQTTPEIEATHSVEDDHGNASEGPVEEFSTSQSEAFAAEDLQENAPELAEVSEFAEDSVPFETDRVASEPLIPEPFDTPTDALEAQPLEDVEDVEDVAAASEVDLQPGSELDADQELDLERELEAALELDAEPPLVAQFSTRRNPDDRTPKLGGVTRADAPPLDDFEPEEIEAAPAPTPVIQAPIAIIRNEDAVEDDRFSSGQRAAALAAIPPLEDTKAEPEFALSSSPITDEERLLDEADRLTVFGARQRGHDTDGRSKYLGIVLGVFLFVFLAGVASWATVFSNDGLANLFDDRPEPIIAEPAQPIVTPDALPTETSVAPTVEDPAPDTELASLQPELTDEDAAVLDALTEARPEPAEIGPQTEAEKKADYAVTGIWATAPTAPEPVSIVTIDDIYQTSIDPGSTLNDAIALAPPPDAETPLLQVPSPAAPDIAFDLDERGLVKPTPEGTPTPEGAIVFSGPPPVRQPDVTPERPGDVTVQPTVAAGAANTALAAIRPRLRPAQLIENSERSSLGGSTLSELATIRPVARAPVARTPDQQSTEIDEALAVAMSTSVRPNPRAANFSRVVARATPAPAPAPAAPAARAPEEPQEERARTVRSIAPRTVKPTVPTSASVTRQATLENAINLRKVNLIGVFGKPSERRALVRMPNGRYKKVQVGDSLDGGRVSAIGDSELRYSKGARNVVLRMPRG
ncbi:MAG: hypothetical protein ABJM43_09985 [Paracoccaceae bacterium]